MTAFLESFSAKDLGIVVAGEDFIAVQDHTEEFTQEIAWRGGYGSDGPILRTIRNADESTVSFSAVLTKAGAARGLTDIDKIKSLRDFEVHVNIGDKSVAYQNCNWRRVARRGTLTEVMLDFDLSIPGFVND